MKKEDRAIGSLVGGAVGDALGYPVEFDDYEQIVFKYGKMGITELVPVAGVARISDDTQMTLFTLDGIFRAKSQNMLRRKELPAFLYEAYLDWLSTQMGSPASASDSPLMSYPELFFRRAPGNTCLSALYSGVMGTVDAPINNSKGCGGVMRVAPIAIALSGRKGYTPPVIASLCADAAAITHGHTLGFVSAAAFGYLLTLIMVGGELRASVEQTAEGIGEMYGSKASASRMSSLLRQALELSESEKSDVDAINELGEGWVGEEALAIAVYCALKHKDSFADTVIAAVNHSGDSDSTGSIAGNLIGAYLGSAAIPEKFTKDLELLSLITDYAKRSVHL